MKTAQKIWQVNISYNIEAEDSLKALDSVLTCSPLKPLSFSCEPIEHDCYDDDD